MISEQTTKYFELLGHSAPLIRFITPKTENAPSRIRDGDLSSTPSGSENTFTPVNGAYLKKNVQSCPAFFLEIDADKDGNPVSFADQYRIVVRESGLPYPSFAVHSKKSVHFYYLLDTPTQDLALWEHTQKALAEHIGSDSTLSDLPQLLRVPGFPYRPSDPIPVALKIPERGVTRYAVEDFAYLLEKYPLSLFKKPRQPMPAYTPQQAMGLLHGSIEDQLQQGCDDPTRVFDWDGHKLVHAGGTKYKGYCPGHQSNSGSAFWCEKNANGVWSWACPTCTNNEQHNALSYQHFKATGSLTQPRGLDYVNAKAAIAANHGTYLQTENPMIADRVVHKNPPSLDHDIEPESETQEPTSRMLATAFAKGLSDRKNKKEELMEELYKEYLRVKEEEGNLPAFLYLECVEEELKISERAFLKGLASYEADEIERLEREQNSIDKTDQFSGQGIPQIVPGFIAEGGLTLLTGDSRAGKSTLIADLMASVTLGDNFLGIKPLTSGEVLFTAQDEFAGDSIQRLKDRGIPLSKVSRLPIFSFERHIPKVDEWLANNPQAKLFVIDSLSTASLDSGVSENDAAIAKYLYRLSALAEKHGVAIILTHHENKQGGIAGSNRLMAPCWSVMTVKPPLGQDQSSNRRTVATTKCRAGGLRSIAVERMEKEKWSNGIYHQIGRSH
jgi:hypothetical protein